MGPESRVRLHLDAVVVGVGLSGITALHRLRSNGFKVKAFDSGSGFGGVWHWNRYPGARVDSEFPLYQLNLPEVFQNWEWTQKFGAQPELQAYFDHVAKVLDLEKDTFLNTSVVSATYDVATARWTVETTQHVAFCKYVVFATGALHRSFLPDLPGLKDFQGTVIHTALWPDEIDLGGKRVAVIGAGATGVQVIQEASKQTAQLFVGIRNPPYCLPMCQKTLTKEEQLESKKELSELLANARKTLTGYSHVPLAAKVSDHTPEEREAHWESVWPHGGFTFLQSNYSDMLTDLDSNRAVYDFWSRKVRSRVSDPVKRDIVAPLEPPYPFGTRRTPLEQDFYECIDQPNVELIDLRKTTIKSINKTGMLTSDGTQRDFDIIIMATGFDSFTGSLNAINIQTTDGRKLSRHWEDGCKTYLGVFVHGLPNAFLLYSPQAPTAFANGPTIIECQTEIAVATIKRLEHMQARSIEATEAAEEEWGTLLEDMAGGTLLPLAGGWWTGANIPGKTTQNFNFIGGLNTYESMCNQALANWKGFEILKDG